MKTVIEPWSESVMDLEDYQVERALQNGAIDAIRRARQCGTNFVTEDDDGNTKRFSPNETGVLEQQALANLDRLNRIIAELEAKLPSAPTLNDRPTGNASPTKY